jgi:hypothetical protein
VRTSVVKARALWFVDINELNPHGKSLYPDIAKLLADEYEFEKIPQSASNVNKDGGFEFTQGVFESRAEHWIDVDLVIYNNGVSADSRSSTSDSEAFLADVLELLVNKGGLEFDQGMVNQKAYLSELSIRTDKSLLGLNPKLSQFAERLSSLVPKEHRNFEPIAITFGSESTNSILRLAPFSFERKIGASFSQNRYYSQAPIHTEQHKELLEQFESMFLE